MVTFGLLLVCSCLCDVALQIFEFVLCWSIYEKELIFDVAYFVSLNVSVNYLIAVGATVCVSVAIGSRQIKQLAMSYFFLNASQSAIELTSDFI